MSFSQYLKKNMTRVIIVVLLLVLVIVNIGIKLFFNQYLNQKIEANDSIVIETIRSLAEANDLNYSNFEALSITNNAYIIAYNNGNIILETNNPNSNANSSANGRGMMGRFKVLSSLDKSQLTFREYPISGSDRLTTVSIGRSMEILSDSDEGNFLFAINAVVIVVFLLAFLLLRMLMTRLSKAFSEPVDALVDQVDQIANHHALSPLPEGHFIEFNKLSETLFDLNEKLSYQEQLRKRLTSDLAHELKNPLAILSSHIEAFLDGVWQPTNERLEKCGDEIKRLTNLINELSELTALEGTMNIERAPTNLSELLKNVLAQYDAVVLEKQLTLSDEIQSSVTVALDPRRMVQVLINLMTNAVKYARESGGVTVRLFTENNVAVLEIIDDGIGISEADLPHIFERFYRADTLRGKTTGGLGIGLSIVKAICDAHGFTIHVDSVLDVGTKFTIVMPL
ncbi:HAMP domain-containing histidine kinase [Fusibacter paucivorans]|uniref:histidine kinase n=1 Tax=Fusibacter paucivorans TaxID=76009 RepID=A0ABS5PM08_9FIRM|nr:HAMP domain-containing sensor histidine kinase [Fusibacter paucivorans]MBS7525631.1 HAMP domain-containing histidine kinase [Fusibacter paucivorans]